MMKCTVGPCRLHSGNQYKLNMLKWPIENSVNTTQQSVLSFVFQLYFSLKVYSDVLETLVSWIWFLRYTKLLFLVFLILA